MERSKLQEAQEVLARFGAAKQKAPEAQQPRALYHFNTYGPVINMPAGVPMSLKAVLSDLGYSPADKPV